jgi:hypothetical protein
VPGGVAREIQQDAAGLARPGPHDPPDLLDVDRPGLRGPGQDAAFEGRQVPALAEQIGIAKDGRLAAFQPCQGGGTLSSGCLVPSMCSLATPATRNAAARALLCSTDQPKAMVGGGRPCAS